ncbi:MAG: hypothetical protein KBT12_07835 [Bacteroidales bacterium]|nr:hypothetical protein [Candidatus Physcousia equi]
MSTIQRIMNDFCSLCRASLWRASLLFCPANLCALEPDSAAWRPEWHLDFTAEQQVTSEGRHNYASLLRLEAKLPLGGGWSAEIASLSACMTSETSIGGDLQVFSNLDAGNIGFTLAVCGFRWCHEDRHRGEHALSFGIRNMNEDYFASPLTSFFTNSSCGIFPTVGANHPAPNYPEAGVGVHYRYTTPCTSIKGNESQWSVQASLYNGMADSHLAGRHNLFRFRPQSDGVLALAQVHYRRGNSEYFLGTSQHCGQHQVRPSLWAYAEQAVMPQFALLASYGQAFGDDALCRHFCGLGMKYGGRRVEAGLFTDYTRMAGIDEWATELTCQIPCCRFLTLQPALHLITTDSQTRLAALLRLNLVL